MTNVRQQPRKTESEVKEIVRRHVDVMIINGKAHPLLMDISKRG